MKDQETSVKTSSASTTNNGQTTTLENNENKDMNTTTASSSMYVDGRSLTLNGNKQVVQSNLSVNATAPSKSKLIQLEEDEYIQAVSEIVERDFFPNLKKMKLQNEFLEAVDNVELEKARNIGIELAKLSAAEQEKADKDSTPHSTVSKGLQGEKEQEPSKKYNTKMSLDAFMSKYTSEDNASFQELIEKHNMNRRRKYDWAFDKEKGTFLLRDDDTGATKMIEGSKAYPVDPKGLIEGWKFKTKNSLIYYPEGVKSSIPGSTGKVINHASTRMEGDELISTGAKGLVNHQSQSEERMRTQQVWRDIAEATPALFSKYRDEIDPSSINSQQKHVNGYSMVAVTPNLVPEKDVDPSDLMTWGMIEGTPLLLDAGKDHNAGGPAFKLPPTPRREELGMRLSERASRNIRKRKEISTPTNSTPFGKTPGTGRTGWDALTPGGNKNSFSSSMTPGNVNASPVHKSKQLSAAAQNLLKKASSFSSNFGARFGQSSSNTISSNEKTPSSLQNNIRSSIRPSPSHHSSSS